VKRLVVCLLAGGVLLVAGCSTPGPAPVASREQITTPTTPRYRVKPGDTLTSIAWAAGLDYRELAAWNGIRNPNRIYVGQVLQMQPPLRKAEPPNTALQPPAADREHARRVAKATTGRASAVRKPPVAASTRVEPAVSAAAVLRWAWPTDGRVSQTFSSNDRRRQGIKIAGILGQPIRAAEAGKIVYSGSGLIGYGQLIIIKHNKNYLSAYGHNRKILVKEGDQVARGETIGEMGRPPEGEPLLHFEIRRGGTPVDPMGLLPPQG